MKRIKKQTIEIAPKFAPEKYFTKIGTKQVVGHSRIQHSGQNAINVYTLEDGSTVIEDDAGKAVKKMPDQPKRAKREKAAA